MAAGQGWAEQAARLLAAANALRTHMGTPVRPVHQEAVEGALAAARAALGEADFAAAWAAGQTLPVDEIVGAIA